MTTTDETETPKPIIFLDVDGVLNACTSSTLPFRVVNSGRACPEPGGRSYLIQWDPEIIERLKDIHESGRAEIKWLTTWRHGANRDLRELLGLPEFDVIAEPGSDAEGWREPFTRAHGWWKFDLVRDYYELNGDPKQKYVWLDDDLAYANEAREWTVGKNFLTIAPATHKGLLPGHLDQIEAFIAE